MQIYVIGTENGTAVKIGIAYDPIVRMKQLQTGNPNKLILMHTMIGTEAQEHYLHNHYKAYCLMGEWFDFGSNDPVEMVTKAIASMHSNAPLDDYGNPQIFLSKDDAGWKYFATREMLIENGVKF